MSAFMLTSSLSDSIMDTMEDTLKYRLGDVEQAFKEFDLTPVFNAERGMGFLGMGLHAKVGNYTVSCQWHPGVHCENHMKDDPEEFCNDFELGIWETNSGKWMPLHPDSVYGDSHVIGYVEWNKLVPILCVVLNAHQYNKPELMRTIGTWV